MSVPLIAVTMGDPPGSVPKSACSCSPTRPCANSPRRWSSAISPSCGAARSGPDCPRPIPPRSATSPSSMIPVSSRAFVSAKTGAAGYGYVLNSIEAALAGDVAAVATAPLNKEALRAAGVPYPGHTEIFADKTGATRACMFQYSDEVRASFVTVHCGYHEVPALMTVERILDVIELTADAMRRIRGTEPVIGVLGLNPHAGEHGLFGNREEERLIEPAMELARQRGIHGGGTDSSRHRLSPRTPTPHRCLRLHVPRPGPHPAEGPRLRHGGEHDPGAPHHPHQRRPRHRLRHRVGRERPRAAASSRP